MTKNTWLTKEVFLEEIAGKDEQKIKSIIKKYLTQNWVKFKNKTKCKSPNNKEIDQTKILHFIELANKEIENNTFIEDDENKFYQDLLERLNQLSPSILPEDMFIAMYATTYEGTYNQIVELASTMVENDILYNEQGKNTVAILREFETLNHEEQENLIKILHTMIEAIRNLNGKNIDFSILSNNAAILLGEILKYYNLRESKVEGNILVFLQELQEFTKFLTWYQKEQPKNKEIFELVHVMTYLYTDHSQEDERKILENSSKFTKSNLALKIIERNLKIASYIPTIMSMSEKIYERINKLNGLNQKKKSEFQKKNAAYQELKEKLSLILQNQETPTYINLSNETIDFLSLEILVPVIEILLDYNTNAFNQLFSKQKTEAKTQINVKKEISTEQRECYEKVKEYYKNGDIVKIPLDVNEFQLLLKKANFSEEETKTILKLASETMKKQKEERIEAKVEQAPSIEKTENQLMYLLSDKGNCYALKDIDSIPIDYYSSFANLLLSIKNGTFKNLKTFKANERLNGLLEVKEFKTRIIFRRLTNNCYIILGMFMKKTDKDMGYLRFLNKRQEQFYKTKDQLEEQTVEDQVAMTEQILSKLQATKPMKLERNWKEKMLNIS